MLNKDFKEFVALLNSNGVEYPPMRIDLLTGIDGVDFVDCYPRRANLAVGGVALPVLNFADFKANKRASGRAKDLADLESLDALPDGESP